MTDFYCSGCGSTQSIEEIRAEHPHALSCCPERKQAPRIEVELLSTYEIKDFSILVFPDHDSIRVPPGEYYPVAFGVVLDVERHRCVATDRASWKLNPGPRYKR